MVVFSVADSWGEEKGFREKISGIFILFFHQLQHELLVDSIELLIRVGCGEIAFAVLLYRLENHQAVLFRLRFLRVFLQRGEAGKVGPAVILQRVNDFQFKLIPVLVGQAD